MKELILHVGRSKCASSTVQRFLSQNPLIQGDDGAFSYHCISRHGDVLSGKALKLASESSSHGYAVSNIDFHDPVQFFRGLRTIKERSAMDEVIIVSNEGLGDEWAHDAWAARLDELGVPIRVFMLTRPPVDWINASWWQSGCWETSDISDWVNRLGRTINFKPDVDQWKTVKSLTQMFVADISQGPLQSFFRFARLDASGFEIPKNSNVGSSADLLRFLLLNRDTLGRSTHDATIEFALNSLLKFKGRSAPFVLSEAMIELAISLSQVDHADLLNEMHWSDAQAKETAGQKYLSAASYLPVAQDFNLDGFLAEGFEPEFCQEMNTISFGTSSVVLPV